LDVALKLDTINIQCLDIYKKRLRNYCAHVRVVLINEADVTHKTFIQVVRIERLLITPGCFGNILNILNNSHQSHPVEIVYGIGAMLVCKEGRNYIQKETTEIRGYIV
jgi:hypothetical protein